MHTQAPFSWPVGLLRTCRAPDAFPPSNVCPYRLDLRDCFLVRCSQPGGLRGFKELVKGGMSEADAYAETQASMDFAKERSPSGVREEKEHTLLPLFRLRGWVYCCVCHMYCVGTSPGEDVQCWGDWWNSSLKALW